MEALVCTDNRPEGSPLLRVKPEYPEEAGRARTSGWVRLSFVIAGDGSTKDVRVTESSPPGIFDRSAVSAVARWLYCPSETGEPYPGPKQVMLQFTPPSMKPHGQ